MEGGHRGAELLSKDIRFRDIRLGTAVDVLLDAAWRRVLGVDVRCSDGHNRFLPLAVVELGSDHLTVSSPLSLMATELAYYRERGRSLVQLRGRPVRRGGAQLGLLRDVAFDADGAVTALVVESPHGLEELPPAPDLELHPDALTRAV